MHALLYTALLSLVIVYLIAVKSPLQRLTLSTTPEESTGPREIGPPWSLPFIPVLLLLGALSIPFGFIAGRFNRWRERKFARQMRSAHRLLQWPDFEQQIALGTGTVIVECYSVHGPFRWWWTADDVYATCPYPVASWLDLDDQLSSAMWTWCHQIYADHERGRALFVEGVPAKALARPGNILDQSRLRWVVVAPPETSKQHRKA